MGARLLIGARWYGPARRPSFPSYASPLTFLNWKVVDHGYGENAYVTRLVGEIDWLRWIYYLTQRSWRDFRITNIDGT